MCLLSISRNEAHFIWLFIRWQKSKSAALKYFSLQFNTLTGSSPACPSKGESCWWPGHVDGCEGDGSAEENGLMRIRPGYQKDLCFVDVWSRWKPLQMVNQHPILSFSGRSYSCLPPPACCWHRSCTTRVQCLSSISSSSPTAQYPYRSFSPWRCSSLKSSGSEVICWSTAISWTCLILGGKAGWKYARGCEKLLGGW